MGDSGWRGALPVTEQNLFRVTPLMSSVENRCGGKNHFSLAVTGCLRLASARNPLAVFAPLQ
jgi:hypothetical protein